MKNYSTSKLVGEGLLEVLFFYLTIRAHQGGNTTAAAAMVVAAMWFFAATDLGRWTFEKLGVDDAVKEALIATIIGLALYSIVLIYF